MSEPRMSKPKLSDFELVRRPVVEPAETVASARIRLTPLPEGTVLQAVGKDAAALALFAEAMDLSVRPNGPDQWYLVGDKALMPAALGEVAPMLPGFSIVDQSHGRVRFAVEGAAAADVLAKGTGLDLSTLHPGDATTTLIGHIAAHITRSGAGSFELMPLRGFAENLWHDLRRMAAEFAY